MDEDVEDIVKKLHRTQRYCSNHVCGKIGIGVHEGRFTWIIDDCIQCISHVTSTYIISPICTVYGNRETLDLQLLIMFPYMYKNFTNGTHLFVHSDALERFKICLIYLPSSTLANIEKIYQGGELSIVDKDGTVHMRHTFKGITRGRHILLSWQNLLKKTNFRQYLSDGKLILNCIIYFNNDENSNMFWLGSEDISNSPRPSIIQDFEKFMLSSKFSDIKLVVGDKTFPSHKIFLSARSPVFSTMLDIPMKEKEENIIKIKDVQPDVMTELLRYIYTNKVENMETLLLDLLAAANMYQLDGLKSECEKVLVKKLTIDNWAENLKIADHYETCLLLRKAVLEFMMNNKEQVCALVGFNQILNELSPSLLIEIIEMLLVY